MGLIEEFRRKDRRLENNIGPNFPPLNGRRPFSEGKGGRTAVVDKIASISHSIKIIWYKTKDLCDKYLLGIADNGSSGPSQVGLEEQKSVFLALGDGDVDGICGELVVVPSSQNKKKDIGNKIQGNKREMMLEGTEERGKRDQRRARGPWRRRLGDECGREWTNRDRIR